MLQIKKIKKTNKKIKGRKSYMDIDRIRNFFFQSP